MRLDWRPRFDLTSCCQLGAVSHWLVPYMDLAMYAHHGIALAFIPRRRRHRAKYSLPAFKRCVRHPRHPQSDISSVSA